MKLTISWSGDKVQKDERSLPAPATPPASRYFTAVEPPSQLWCSSSHTSPSSCSCSLSFWECEWSTGNGSGRDWVDAVGGIGDGEATIDGGLSSALRLTSPALKNVRYRQILGSVDRITNLPSSLWQSLSHHHRGISSSHNTGISQRSRPSEVVRGESLETRGS